MNKIYFTADLHFGHTNILKHQPNRPLVVGKTTWPQIHGCGQSRWFHQGLSSVLHAFWGYNRSDGKAHALSGNTRKRNVDDVPLSDGDMESQTLRLHHASWSLPWKARWVQCFIAWPSIWCGHRWKTRFEIRWFHSDGSNLCRNNGEDWGPINASIR